MKNEIKDDPRIITVDRYDAQISAIEDIFPSSIVVFCSHIRRDLLKYFDSNDDIAVGFDDIKIHVHRCDKYAVLLKGRLETLYGNYGYQMIVYLLNSQDRWLPKRLIKQGVNFYYTNNRSETFFATYKTKYGFNRVTLTELVKRLVNLSWLKLVNSQRSILKNQKRYEDFQCFTREDIHKLGRLALDLIANEYLAERSNKNNYPFCVYFHIKEMKSLYTLPCLHVVVYTGGKRI